MNFLANLWNLFLEAAPYLTVGFVVAGLLHQYLPPSFVQKHLGGGSIWNIFKASIIGTPVPLCSCGVVPVGLGLQKDGASKATTVSFLIATPENGVESISLTYSFFGLPFTMARLVFSILVANITALAVALLGQEQDGEENDVKASVPPCCASNPPQIVSSCCKEATSLESCREPPRDERNGYRFVVDDFVPSIARWVILGFLVSAMITTFLPADLLPQIDPIWAVPLAGLVGVPMYVCASASTPIAYSLYAGGLSPGAVLVFLLTGPATNSANVPVYMKALGSRTTAIYYAGIYFVSVIMGLILDIFVSAPLLLGVSQQGHDHGFHPTIWHYAGAVILTALLARGWRQDSVCNIPRE